MPHLEIVKQELNWQESQGIIEKHCFLDKHNGTFGEFERTSILIFIEEFYLLLTFLRPGLQCSPLIFILVYLRGASSQIVVSEVSQTLLTIATLLEYY